MANNNGQQQYCLGKDQACASAGICKELDCNWGASVAVQGCQSACFNPGQISCAIDTAGLLQGGYLQQCGKDDYCLGVNFQCGFSASQQKQMDDQFELDNQYLDAKNQTRYPTRDQDPSVKALKQKFVAAIVDEINKPENIDFKRTVCLSSVFNPGLAGSCGCDIADLSKGGLINCADIRRRYWRHGKKDRGLFSLQSRGRITAN